MAEVNVRVSDSGRLFPDAVVIKVDEQEIIAGQDGISPVVTVTEIGTAEAVSSHGYDVYVSDAAGVHTYSVYDGASAYAQAVAGGYSGTEEEFAADLIGFNTRAAEATAGATAAAAYADAASDSATAAATSESNAADSATAAASSASEAASSAGTATTAAGSASSSATAAAGSATTASNKASEAASSESNAASSATAASASATAAAASETAAASSASSAASSATAAAASAAAIEEYEHDAEAWAIGKRGGTDVDSSDATYQNNSEYYAEQAAASSSSASSAAAAAAQSATEAASEAGSSKSYSRSAYISSTMASGSATAAADAQTAAETAAATAEGHATNAASSATAASGSATAAGNAQTAAEDAQTAAETAQAAAEDAQDAAEAAAQSIAQSAAQIAQNTSDIDDLKSAFNSINFYENVVLNKKYTYTGNTANQYVQNVFPVTVTNGSIALTETEGVDDDVTIIVRLAVQYTDGTETNLVDITEKNHLYRFQTNANKTISQYVFRLTRANQNPASNVTSSWSLVCINGKTNDEKLSGIVEKEDKKQGFSDATTGTEYVTYQTLTDTSMSTGVWKQIDVPADIENPYICVTKVTGLNNPSHLLYVFVLYTDNTSQNIFVDNVNLWAKLNINKNKTVQSYSLYCYRSDEAVSQATESSWTVAFSDGNILTEQLNELENKTESAQRAFSSSLKALSNKVYDNHSPGTFYGVENVDYIAVSTSENWQHKSYTKKIAFSVEPNKLLSIGCIERDGLGNQYASILIKRNNGSSDVNYYASSQNTKLNEFGGFVYTVYTPSNSYEVEIQFYGISNATSQGESSIIGHAYFVHGAFAVYGEFLQVGASAMPTGWENEIENIKTEQKDSFVIAIQTDTHYFNGCSNVIGYNLKQLSETVSMDCIASLGDLIQGYADDDETFMRESMTTIVERYCNGAECPVMLLIGNHDSNYMYASAHSGTEFSFGELYARMIKPTINKNPNIKIENGKLYYYEDFPALRLIALNTNDGYTPHNFGISQAQQTWFENEALNIDKPVLVLSHVPLVSGISDNYDSSYAGIITALNAFKTNGGTVVACFFGHVHMQTSALSTGNILQVGFTWSGGYAGQDTAEIVMIDIANKTIKTKGFGNASSREFTFD